MNSIGRIITRFGLMLLVLAMAACASQPTAIPGQAQTPVPVIPTETAAPSRPTALVVTALPASGTPQPDITGQPGGSTPVDTAVPAGGELTVTRQNDGQTITLQVGQRFLLNLGEDTFTWSPVVTDESVVSRVIGITVIRGAQGIYEAHKSGQTTLVATGDPHCRSQKPACGMPSISFQVNIVVQ